MNIVADAEKKINRAVKALKSGRATQEGINFFYQIAGLLVQRLWFYNRIVAMMEELHSDHANLMVSIWPNMSKECDNYKEFENQKLLLGASPIYDPYSEDGRKLYWMQAKEGLFCHGIDAWWCDSSEPFTPEWNHMGQPEPSTMYQEFFDTSCKYIPAQLTNSYGLYHARTMYEGQHETTNEKRVVNLIRNGYIGQQRYGAISSRRHRSRYGFIPVWIQNLNFMRMKVMVIVTKRANMPLRSWYGPKQTRSWIWKKHLELTGVW